MQAVLRGQGIALMDEIFAEEEINAGRLLRLFDLAIPSAPIGWLPAASNGSRRLPCCSWAGSSLGSKGLDGG
nr:hypothetical protein [Rhizobium sp. L43]